MSRNAMYVESIGCLPLKWLDDAVGGVPLTKIDEDTKKEITIEHADGTPVIFYPDARVNLDKVERTLKKFMPEGVEWAIFIHDLEEEEEEKPHLHIAFNFPSAKSASAIRKLLGLYDKSKDNFIQLFTSKKKGEKSGIYSKRSMFSYLPHITEEAVKEGKINYEHYIDNPLKMRSNFDFKGYVKGITSDVEAKKIDVDDIITKLVSGEMRQHHLINPKDGEDILPKFYLNNMSKCDNAMKVFNKRYAKMRKEGEKQVETIFITGDAGSGKTTFAKEYAERKFESYFVTGSQNDPLQDYMGEECIIFDDARASDFEASDWLKLLDPYTRTSVKSRYFNKAMPIKCLIITSTEHFESFFVYAKNKGGSDEPVDQFVRRFSTVIEISNDLPNVYQDRLISRRTYPKNNIGDLREPYITKAMQKLPVHKRQELLKNKAYEKWALEELQKRGISETDRYSVARIYAVKKLPKNARHEKLKVPSDKMSDTSFDVSYVLNELDGLAIRKLEEMENENLASDILNYFA